MADNTPGRIVPEQDLIPESIKKAVSEGAGKAGSVITGAVKSLFSSLAESAKQPSIYDIAYPAKRAEWGEQPEKELVGSYSGGWEGSSGVMPKLTTTETTDSEGKKTTKTSVEMIPTGGKGGGRKEGVDYSNLFAALANAAQPVPRVNVGTDMSSLQIPTVPNLAAMNERARRAYAPFLPPADANIKPWQRLMATMANAFTQTRAEREKYFGTLDRNFQLNFEQQMQKEQQKRLKMEGQLAEEATLRQLQRYQQQQKAAEQFAQLVTQYGPQIFQDRELNMGAGALMEMMGLNAGAIRIPQYKPHKASMYDRFSYSYRAQHPNATETEVYRAFKEEGREGAKSPKEAFYDMMFPKDPLQRQVAMSQIIPAFMEAVGDPRYLQSLQALDIDIDDVLHRIQTYYPELITKGGKKR